MPGLTHPTAIMQKPTLTYLHVRPNEELPPVGLLPSAPFLAVLVIDEVCEEMWRWEASRWLAGSHCRYVLAWGQYCEDWAESVDDANLEAYDYDDIPEDKLVMTTSHEEEELDDVFWFARHRARHPTLVLSHTVIIHIAERGRKDVLEKQYGQA